MVFDAMNESDAIQRIARARAALELARVELVEAMQAGELLGVTQREIGAAAGVSQGEVWKILRRGKRIS